MRTLFTVAILFAAIVMSIGSAAAAQTPMGAMGVFGVWALVALCFIVPNPAKREVGKGIVIELSPETALPEAFVDEGVADPWGEDETPSFYWGPGPIEEIKALSAQLVALKASMREEEVALNCKLTAGLWIDYNAEEADAAEEAWMEAERIETMRQVGLRVFMARVDAYMVRRGTKEVSIPTFMDWVGRPEGARSPLSC